MVSQMFLDMANGIAQTWGLSPEAMATIIGIIFALGLTIALGMKFKNTKVSMVIFAMILFLEVIIQMISWYTIIIPIIILVGYLWGIEK